MAGGGIWKAQNKVRPGAYVNFKSKPKPLGTLSDRGIMTCALPLTWGPENELISVYATDILDGASLSKVGITAFDGEESLPLRLALSGCAQALIFRADVGGDKATKSIDDDIIVNALYPGTKGNDVSVKITTDKPKVGQSLVEVFFKGDIQETFGVVTERIEALEDIESKWIEFEVVGSEKSVPVVQETKLSGGTNGTVTSQVYSKYFSLLDNANWQCMAIDTEDETLTPLIITKIKSLRYDFGKKVQAVVYDDVSADDDGVLGVKQGFKTDVETIPENLFPLWVASHTAGAYINESLTAFVVPGAVEIINPIPENEIADALNEGWFLLSYRQDGKVCVEQDINTFTSLTPDKGYAFRKNRVVRCLDEIGNLVPLIFNRSFAGKVDNNAEGRNIYKNEIIHTLEQLQGINALQNVDGPADVTVLPGIDIDAVVADLAVQPVDSMEKLYMTVEVDG